MYNVGIKKSTFYLHTSLRQGCGAGAEQQKEGNMNGIPKWIAELPEEDLNFIKRFVLSSGSLKEMAGIYGVTYPTVRSRLDRVIKRIMSSDEKEEEAYISLIKKMVLEEKLEFDAAAILIREYRKEKQNGNDE